MVSWGARFASLTFRQLPLLWLVLTISPNLNPMRSVWVLAIVYVMLYGAIAGFESVFLYPENKSNLRFRVTKVSVVWVTAAVLYVSAAVFSLLNVNVLFFVITCTLGILSLGVDVFFTPKTISYVLLKAFLQGIFSFLLIYVGINNLPIQHVVKASVLMPGFVITLLFVVFGLASIRRISTLTSWLLLATAIGWGEIYLLYFIDGKYALSALLVVVVFSIQLFLRTNPDIGAPLIKERVTNWIFISILNGYFFYLFTDHTQILQLI